LLKKHTNGKTPPKEKQKKKHPTKERKKNKNKTTKPHTLRPIEGIADSQENNQRE